MYNVFFCKHVMKALISLLDKEMNVRLVLCPHTLKVMIIIILNRVLLYY